MATRPHKTHQLLIARFWLLKYHMARLSRIALLIAIVALTTGGTWLMGPGKGSHGSVALVNFSDDFSGTLSNWTTDAGSWSIVSGRLTQNSGGFVSDLIHYNTPCATI